MESLGRFGARLPTDQSLDCGQCPCRERTTTNETSRIGIVAMLVSSLLRHQLVQRVTASHRLLCTAVGNTLGNKMPRYIGKICDRHPELDGERRKGNCPACQRERVRSTPSRDVQRRKVRKWRAANRDRYPAGPHARSAVRRARKKKATGGGHCLSQASIRSLVIEGTAPRHGCRSHRPTDAVPCVRSTWRARSVELAAADAGREFRQRQPLSALLG